MSRARLQWVESGLPAVRGWGTVRFVRHGRATTERGRPVLDSGGPPADRRSANAAATRRAVVRAARRLFADRGYFHVRIDDIAAAAGVSPATVYARCGGKQGLLRTLIQEWSQDSTFERAAEDSSTASTAEEMLVALGDGAAHEFARLGDVIRLVHRAADQEPFAADWLRSAAGRRRRVLDSVVVRMRGTGRLAGQDDDAVVDAILFHLRPAQLALLIENGGWDPEQARDWIVARLQAAVLLPADRADAVGLHSAAVNVTPGRAGVESLGVDEGAVGRVPGQHAGIGRGGVPGAVEPLAGVALQDLEWR